MRARRAGAISGRYSRISAAVTGPQPLRTSSDARVEVGLARREPLGERQREPGLDQHVQAPALDLGLLVLAPHGCLDRLGHGARVIRAAFDDPCRRKVGGRSRTAVSARRARCASSSRASISTARSSSRWSRVAASSRASRKRSSRRLHRDLRVPLDLALGDALEPLGLAALPLDEHDVEAAADVGLGALDRLRDRRLPSRGGAR